MKPSLLLFLLLAGTASIYAQPANDDFANAIDVSGIINSCSADAEYTTVGGTGDLNTGSCWNNSGPRFNVWFSFVATTTSMKVTIDRGGAKGTQRRTQTAIWQSDGTTQVACKVYAFTDEDVIMEAVGTLTIGLTYYISVDSYNTGYYGSFTLCLADNDVSYDFYEGAIDVTSIMNSCSADAEYTTVGGTGDKNAGSCWDNSGPRFNRWFSFVAATTNIKITIDRGGAKGTQRRTQIALWLNDGITQVNCKRYAYTDEDVELEVVGGLTIGQTYYISVDSYNTGYYGSFTLCLADNDVSYDFYEGAIEIIDQNNWCSADAAYTTIGGTGDKNAGSCWDNSGPRFNRWFKFTAATTEISIKVDRGGSNGTQRRTQLAIWESDGLTEVSCKRYAFTDEDVVVEAIGNLTIGNTYYISVDSYNTGYYGSFTLCVNNKVTYDFYERAIELTDLNNWCSADAEYTTIGASSDKNAGSCWNNSGPRFNRWFKFTAISPNVTIMVDRGGSKGSQRRTQLALWESDGTTELDCQRYVGTDDDVSISNGTLTIGNIYYISVDSYNTGYYGSFTLCINNIDGTYYTRQSGAWTDPNTWSTVGFGGAAAADYPQVGDVANIQDHSLTITSNEVAAEVNMTVVANNAGLTISNGSLNVAGQFNTTNAGNNFNIAYTIANSTITVNDNFIVNRNGGTATMSLTSSISTFNFNNNFTINSTAGTGNNTISFGTLSTVNIGNDLTLSNTGGPKTILSIDNSDATISNNLVFTASADNLVELDLANAANLFLENNITQGSPAYGILLSTGNSTVHYASTTNLQTMASTDGSGTGDVINYENVTINNSRITSPQVTLAGNVTISGVLTFIDGELSSTSSNLLTLSAGSSTIGASINSFVDGFIKKIGNTDFEFPVGDANFWQPISIANLTGDAATEFTAEYLEQIPTNNLNLKSPDANGDMNNISGLEYWGLSNTGTASNADITLHWKNQTRSDIDDSGDLRVAHYTGSEWENIGQDAINFADPGSITIIGVSSFSPFTFGSLSNTVNALPVELLSFIGVQKDFSIDLQWETASENNNDYFEVEKSNDGEVFESIGRVSGNGNSSILKSYSFPDYSLADGLVYYRLRQVDFDGRFKYSKTIVVKSALQIVNSLPTIYPNPTFDNNVNIIIPQNETLLKVIIFNNGAKAISTSVFDTEGYMHNISINSLNKGIHVFRIITNKATYNRKLIVN